MNYISTDGGTGCAAVRLQVLHVPYTQIACSEMESAVQIKHVVLILSVFLVI